MTVLSLEPALCFMDSQTDLKYAAELYQNGRPFDRLGRAINV